MTDKEILSKAIDKAIDNGWELKHPIHGNSSIEDFLQELFDDVKDYPYMLFPDIAGIIFSHSFAKAFWGEEFIDDSNICKDESQDPILNDAYINSNMKIWQYHLQQMVLEPEPLKYLEKFL